MQCNIVILKHCDAIKGMATGVLQEAMTQIFVGGGGYFPCKICSDCHFFRQKTKIKQISTPDPFVSRFNAVILFVLK